MSNGGRFHLNVSIPNGMEFYVLSCLLCSLKTLSFNSQRDGILLSCQGRAEKHRGVSIPNGMEFYRRQRVFAYRLYNVSIPNGMEFYLTPCSPKSISSIVSIPNGMEFYQNAVVAKRALVKGFNSQRDGILRKGKQ